MPTNVDWKCYFTTNTKYGPYIYIYSKIQLFSSETSTKDSTVLQHRIRDIFDISADSCHNDAVLQVCLSNI